ncbi:MAG: iron-sulfur protein, partial [Steroidobacteraceae bacterium]
EKLATSRVWHAVTPATKSTTNYFFAMGSPDGPGVEAMVEYLRPVVAEDVFATEEIEKMIATLDEVPRELLLKSDATAVQGRRILQAMMLAEGQGVATGPGTPQG